MGRENPRSAVTQFLETCRTGDYNKASQYLDASSGTSVPERAGRARELEAILNSASQFDVNRLSQDPDGSGTSDVATVSRNGQSYILTVSRTGGGQGNPAIWRFSPQTVALIPFLTPSLANPVIARYLPKPFLTIQFLETPLWKWIALLLAASVLLSLSRFLDTIFRLLTKRLGARLNRTNWILWVNEIIRPIRVIVCLAIFKLALELTDPTAIARLYIGRVLQLIFAWTVAWCSVELIDLFFRHLEGRIDVRHRVVSRSLLYMGRRTANALVVIFTILVLLSNWGYNTTTLIAGLGVGGIAVALAAQQTIANVFGGVSIIGDHPVNIGDFGNFGGVIGTVEDIGMRSTRVRTLNRTVVSVPNSNFAGFNLENYSLRDKILFNPSFQIKRVTPDDKIHALIEDLGKALSGDKRIEVGESPVRITALSSTAINLEVFCYVRTDEIDKFYPIQGDLLLTISRILESTGVELT